MYLKEQVRAYIMHLEEAENKPALNYSDSPYDLVSQKKKLNKRKG